MRILYLAHRVPYPPNKGEKIRYYHHLRHLAAAHDVDLLAFADRQEDLQWHDALAEFCRTVHLVPLRHRIGLWRGAVRLLRGGSVVEGYFGSPRMWREVRRAAAARPVDLAWAGSLAMFPYLDAIPAERRIVDLVDIDSERSRELADRTRAPLSWLYGMEARRVARLERRATTVAERVLVVSGAEAACLRSHVSGAPVQVVENGVDTNYFRPGLSPACDGATRLVFVGTLDYQANVDAIVFFVREVLPALRQRLPGVVFTAVGHRPAARVRAALRQAGDGARLAGSVADVRPFLAAATVCVVPLFLGRGVKNKVLEAMAMGVPVVATSTAVLGLAVQDDTHLLIADDARRFTDAVVAVAMDPDRRRHLTENALRYIRQSHTWEHVLRDLPP